MSDLRPAKLVFLFFMACLALSYPVLSIFDQPEAIGGIPMLVAYLFGAWIILIGLTWWWIRQRRPRGK